MPQILEKRSSESRLFDIDAGGMLAADETVTAITGIVHDANSGSALTFGNGVVNDAAVVLPSRVAPAGELIQFRIAGGSVPTGASENLYRIRVRFSTSLSNNLEAVVVLRVRDNPL